MFLSFPSIIKRILEGWVSPAIVMDLHFLQAPIANKHAQVRNDCYGTIS